MSLSDIFEQMAAEDKKFFDSFDDMFSHLPYKGWTIIKGGKQGYGYEVRNPQGYLSLETSKNGTVDECKQYIDNAINFKASL